VSSAFTLRRELLLSFAVLFVAAVVVAIVCVLLLLPLLPMLSSPVEAALFIGLLVLADLGVLFWFGHQLLSARFVRPIEALTVDVRRIADGEYEHRAEGAESLELRGLEASVNAMADRVIHDQQLMERNIESLEATNAELVEARAEVIQAARLASVGTLGAGIAHEVGNPLSAILAYVDVARSRAEKAGGDTELLAQIRSEALRIDRIVRGLLDYARPRTEEAVAVPPRRVIEHVRQLLDAQGKLEDVQLEVRYEEGVPDVLMVVHRLEQVLVNLLLNAVDAIGQRSDGRIVVTLDSGAGEVRGLPLRREGDPSGINYMHRRRVSRDQGGKGVDPLYTAEHVAVITVSDNGPGIPEEDLEKVFDLFYTTKEPGKGTGLGLSICARLVEGMGGRITVDRGPEGGARFTIRLPGALESERAAEVLQTPEPTRAVR
jgi:two-component system NtrC family sensor kinase